MALRLTCPEEPNDVVRKIGHIPYARHASPNYTFFDSPDRWAFIVYDAQLCDLPQQQWLRNIAGERRIDVIWLMLVVNWWLHALELGLLDHQDFSAMHNQD